MFRLVFVYELYIKWLENNWIKKTIQKLYVLWAKGTNWYSCSLSKSLYEIANLIKLSIESSLKDVVQRLVRSILKSTK